MPVSSILALDPATVTGWAYYDEQYVKVDGEWRIKVIGYTRDFEEWVIKKPG